MHFFKSRQCTSYRRCLMHTKKANNGRRCRSKKKVTAFCCLSSIKKATKNTWILQVAVKAGRPYDNWIVCTALLLHLTWSRVEANSRQSLCIKLGNPLNVSRKLCTKHFQRVEHRKVSIAGVCNRRGPMQTASPHAGLESGQPSCRHHKLARRTVHSAADAAAPHIPWNMTLWLTQSFAVARDAWSSCIGSVRWMMEAVLDAFLLMCGEAAEASP